MGLMKAFAGTAISYINDLWEDYIYCDALDGNTLVQKGHTRSNPGTGKNVNDNVITEGSRIAVNAGQMLIVVENGQMIDFTAEQGGYEYRSETEPTLFCGDFGEALKTSFQAMKGRFAFGGQPTNDQRVYFINTKEIMNNRFGFGNVPYRDAEFNITILLQGFGIYSFVIIDPIIFYSNVCGNVKESFEKNQIETQLKTELQNALLPIMGELSSKGVHYDKLSLETTEILALLKEKLLDKWKKERGLEIRTLAFSNILPDDSSVEKIRELQESRAYAGNKAMLGARVGAAQANAMETAAENTSGSVNGFVGMGLAQGAGSVNVSELLKEEPSTQQEKENREVVMPPAQNTWTCNCGMVNTLNFCPNCGAKKPEKKVCQKCNFELPKELEGMKFCPNCGNQL